MFGQNPYGGQYAPGGYINPYQSRLEAMQPPQPQRYEITRVNGRNGAEAFQLPPNSNILLLDESAPLVWLVQSDGAGYKTCTPYTITPYQAQPTPDFNSLDQRLTRLEAMLNGQPYAGNAGTAPAVPDAGTGRNVGTKPHADHAEV